MKKSDIERFEDKIFYSPDGCWYWTAAQSSNMDGYSGYYGFFHINNKLVLAHRVSYEFYKGKIPEGLNVCHSCDNALCVNPDHLWLGTQKDNMMDCANKKKMGKNRGETHHKAILTEEQAKEILAMKNAGLIIDRYELAKKYGVCYGTIYALLTERSWKYLSR